MTYSTARTKLTDAVNKLDQARTDLLAKLDEIQADTTRTDQWKEWTSEDAKGTFSERTEGLSEVIEQAAAELDAEILRHNTAFDLDSPTLEKALRLAQLGDVLPDSAVTEILSKMTNPAEVRLVQSVFRKAGNSSAELDAANRAESLTAHPVGDLASQTWYVINDPLSSATNGSITDLMDGINAADSAMAQEG